MSFVSIIIPVYNAEQTLSKAIDSGLNQTHPSIEVVVIDDGSKDSSLDILKAFGSAIRYETGPNQGGSRARNRGIELARGEFIQFLDADDWLYPTKIERQLKAIDEYPNATPICDWDSIETDGSTHRITAPPTCDDSFLPLLVSPLPTLSPLHRKSNLEKVGGFCVDLPCSQERDLHLRLAAHGWPLHRIAEPLFAVRRTAGSVSSSYLKVLDQHLSLAQRAREILQQRDDWTDKKARALAAFLTRDARHYVHLGQREKAAIYFSEARTYHPSGGWDQAYGRWTRLAAGLLGPVTLERLLTLLK